VFFAPLTTLPQLSTVPFFVAGATARDLMLVNVYGLRPGRATRDIDFRIAVESWDEFQGLKERMISTGEFAADSKAQQRLVYTDRADGFSIRRYW
jgi:predicted nucleotidyltransferase